MLAEGVAINGRPGPTALPLLTGQNTEQHAYLLPGQAIGYSDLMKCGCVLPNLFVGPAPTDEADFKQSQLMKITAILSLQTEEDVVTGLETCRRAASQRGLTLYNAPVVDFDRADLGRKLRDCVELLNNLLENGDVVYLHCTAGVSRSPTVAAAFLHWKQGWTLDEAITRLMTVRNCCPDAEIIQINK